MPYVIVPVTQIAYAQGWFVSNKLLRRKNPVYVATTKQEMMNFFRRYGKIPKQKETHQFTESGYVTSRFNDVRLVETVKYNQYLNQVVFFQTMSKNPRDLSHEMNSLCINYRYLVDKVIFFIIIYMEVKYVIIKKNNDQGI